MSFRLAFLLLCFALCCTAAKAATIAPPMLDITRQCDAHSRHNVTAMSECVVAESEARSDVLQNWARYSDVAADRCIKVSRKSQRFPYGALDRCLSAELAKTPAPTDHVKK